MEYGLIYLLIAFIVVITLFIFSLLYSYWQENLPEAKHRHPSNERRKRRSPIRFEYKDVLDTELDNYLISIGKG